MADLIDRDEVKRELNAQYAVAKNTANPDAVEQILREVSKFLDSFPAVNRWISCAERLPEVYEKVLTYNDEGIIHENFRLNLRDGSVGWSQGSGVTHWKPRPEPPDND